MTDRTAEAGFELEPPQRSVREPGPVFRFRLPILISVGLLVFVAALLFLFLPRQYRSTMQIVVRAPGANATAAALPVEQGVNSDRLQAELALLHSTKLASDVVNPDWNTRPPEARTSAEVKSHEAAVAAFERQLATRVDTGSNVIQVSCSAADPHSATDLATRLLGVFIANQADIPRTNPVTAFFVSDAAQARKEVENTQQALDQYRSVHPVNRPARALAIEQQIADLRQQMHDTDEQIAMRAGAVLEGERRLAGMPARMEEAIDPDAGSALSVPQLNTMLAIYNDQRATMLTRPIAPALRNDAVLELSHDIASTTTALRLAQRPRPPVQDPGANPMWEQISDRVSQFSAELHTLYQDRDKQTESLADLRHTLAAAQRPDADLALLQLNADVARTAWQMAEQRRSEAQIVDVMDQQDHMNVAVLLRPTTSNTPVSPGPWLIIVCVVLGIVFLAVCVAIYLQRPREEDEEHAAPAVNPFRGSASNFLRGRRPNAYADLGRQPERAPDSPSSSTAAPDHAQWEALATLLQADRDRALEAEKEAAAVAEAEPEPEPAPFDPRQTHETQPILIEPIVPVAAEPARPAGPPSIDSEFVVIPPSAQTSRKPLTLAAPPALTAAVPNFVFENVQSTTTPSSLAFNLQAMTMNAPRSPRSVPPQPPRPVLELAPVTEREPLTEAIPDQLPEAAAEAVSEPAAEPIPEASAEPDTPHWPPMEVRTKPLTIPVTEARREAPPLPEIRTEPLPPVADESTDAEPEPPPLSVEPEQEPPEAHVAPDELEEAPDDAFLPSASSSPSSSSSQAVFLRPAPAIPVGEVPSARLTPFQRMKRRRAVPTLDKNGRATYITYTFDPEPDSGSDSKDKPGA